MFLVQEEGSSLEGGTNKRQKKALDIDSALVGADNVQ
mgnify:CR=1 FL=1